MLRKHENQWAKKTLEEKKEIYNFSNDYKLFLNSSKTEREFIKEATKIAEENGFKVTVSAETADGFAIKAEKSVMILNDHTGGKATCKDKAKCEVCGAEYGELDAKNHTDLKHFPATAATKTTEGNIEYWYCEGCGKYFSDKDGTKEIQKADTVTAKLPQTPQTGDTSNPALLVVLMLVSGSAAIGTAVVASKKKHNR